MTDITDNRPHAAQRRRRQRRATALCIIAILLQCAIPALGAETESTDYPYARALQIMGLFRGTDSGFELDTVPTRAQAVTMLVRLLGMEETALAGSWTHPFTDAGWAEQYIGFAYEAGLVNGVDSTHYGSGNTVTGQQYCTMLLRALGYADGETGEFLYRDAWAFAMHKLGLAETQPQRFTRGDLARLSYAALSTTLYGSSTTLSQHLIDLGCITQGTVTAAAAALPKTPLRTDILVYAVGGDLESVRGELTQDMGEMCQGMGDSMQILLQCGGTADYKNDSLPDGHTLRLQLKTTGPELLEDLGETSMCSSDTLAAFLRWALPQCSGDRLILIFWDHGGGTLGGFGRDELNGDASMSMTVLRKGLDALNRKADLILFDACLMGTAEWVYALRDCGNYLVASEQDVPLEGQSYATWLSALTARPDIQVPALSRMIADSFVLRMKYAGKEATLSVFSLDGAEQMAATAAEALSGAKPEALASALALAEPLGSGEGKDQFDLFNVVAPVTGMENQLKQAFHRLCFYTRSTDDGKYSGLALYLPAGVTKADDPVFRELAALGWPETARKVLALLQTEQNET